MLLQGLAHPLDEIVRNALADLVRVNHLADGLTFAVKRTSKKTLGHDATPLRTVLDHAPGEVIAGIKTVMTLLVVF